MTLVCGYRCRYRIEVRFLALFSFFEFFVTFRRFRNTYACSTREGDGYCTQIEYTWVRLVLWNFRRYVYNVFQQGYRHCDLVGQTCTRRVKRLTYNDTLYRRIIVCQNTHFFGRRLHLLARLLASGRGRCKGFFVRDLRLRVVSCVSGYELTSHKDEYRGLYYLNDLSAMCGARGLGYGGQYGDCGNGCARNVKRGITTCDLTCACTRKRGRNYYRES